jgi:hypothetical protein
MYTAMIGKRDQLDEWWALKEYGKGSFVTRFEKMKNAATKGLFIRLHDQNIEGDFAQVCQKVEAFVQHRHDVAHGIVQMGGNWRIPEDPGPPTGAFLLPPHYMVDKFDEHVRPAYAYTSISLRQLERHLSRLADVCMGMANRLGKGLKSTDR